MTRIPHDKNRKISVKTSAQVDMVVKARTYVNKPNLKVSTPKTEYNDRKVLYRWFCCDSFLTSNWCCLSYITDV
jgi:hypothetical protein